MARALRQDIPSRRTRNTLAQVDPGMADLNPAPGVGRGGPPSLGFLDQAPTGTFQANRALNGEQGVLGSGSVHCEPDPVSSPLGWDSDAFPTDHDLFGDDCAGLGDAGAHHARPGGGESPPISSSHSAPFVHETGLEGGGTAAPRRSGPVPPRFPDSAVAPLPGILAARVDVERGSEALVSLMRLGQLVPIVRVSRDDWCPFCCWDFWCPLSVCYTPGTIGARWSDTSEWGGIEGEFRFLTPPTWVHLLSFTPLMRLGTLCLIHLPVFLRVSQPWSSSAQSAGCSLGKSISKLSSPRLMTKGSNPG
ncbi:hypothetical protein EV361DRAFT_871992 [Lentinula raphanica]|nr:hypothetical protein EV361DRAFT_871992 [Lentinula raphanica]